jgi:hypothetical protein
MNENIEEQGAAGCRMNPQDYKIPPPHLSLSQIWPALLTFCSPLFICFFVYALSVEQLVRGVSWGLSQAPNFSPEGFDRFAHELGGRLQVGIVSAVLRVAAIVAFLFASELLARTIGARWTGILIVLFALFMVYSYVCGDLAHGSKFITVINQVREGVIGGKATKGESAFDLVQHAIRWNIVASLIGGTSIMAAFAAVALRTSPSAEPVTQLRNRSRDLQRATLLGAAFLVSLTALNKTLIDWPQAFIDKDQQHAFASLAGAIASYWGTFGALALISALAPAFVSLNHDIDMAARVATVPAEQTPEEWRKNNGLEFDAKSGLGAAIAALAPILTVPGIDLASKLLH